MRTLSNILRTIAITAIITFGIGSPNSAHARKWVNAGLTDNAQSTSPANAQTPESAPQIDSLVEMLEKTTYRAQDILKTLKPKIAPPFKAVRASEKKLGTSSTMEVTFELLEKKTALAALTKDSLKWKTGPLLPDSGSCPIGRDWAWPKEAKNVSCSAIAENCADLKSLEITGDITCFINLETKAEAKKKTPGSMKMPNSK